VHAAVERWARRMAARRPETARVGYFGSYARGDWGPGSDVDLVVIVRAADQPFLRRALGWDATDLPVPADVVVYTEAEWGALDPGTRFARTLAHETVWVYPAA
jgi:predicted nucleotidyltransferase